MSSAIDVSPWSTVPSIREYYKGKSVFITGASGFAGKSLVQRLLQTCQVDKVYILLRGKRGVNFTDRFNAYLKEEVFSYFIDKSVLDKIIPVEGDISLTRLGLSDPDHQKLADNVSIVFHAAASVKFNEQFKQAVILHVFGTQQVLELCRKMKKFESIIHLSSISAWFVKQRLEEKVYSHAVDPKLLIHEIETMSDREIEELANDYIGDYPKYANTYFFTKTISEVLLKTYAKDLKVGIVRLPFMGGAYKEPIPGWFDSLQTTNAMLVCVATGTLRTVAIEPDTKPDYLPIDCCSNALITVAWHMSCGPKEESLQVFNVTPKPSEVPTVHEAHVVAAQLGRQYPSIRQLLPPASPMKSKPGKVTFYIHTFITMFIAYCVDFTLLMSGKKAFFARLCRKINQGTAEITVLLHKTRIYSDVVNIKNVFASISQEERDIFYCDPAAIQWRQLLTDMWFRVRRTLLKEPDSNLAEAITRMKRLNKMYRTLRFAFGMAIVLAALNYLL